MLSRGWTGRLPVLDETPVAGRTWLQVLTPAALVLCVAAFSRCDHEHAGAGPSRFGLPLPRIAAGPLWGRSARPRRRTRRALGPNGAGKTTLVLHLTGVLRAGAGTVSVSGLSVDDANSQKSAVGSGSSSRIPMTNSSCRRFGTTSPSALRNLGLRGAELEARVASGPGRRGVADLAGPPRTISFGQRRRVAIATVLAMEPDILVLDEPTSNLDPASRRELAGHPASPPRHGAHGHARPSVCR